MKTIIYATDYSKNSEAAFRYALYLMESMNARLIVTHVFGYPTVLGTPVQEPFPDLEADAFRSHSGQLRDFVKRVTGRLPGEFSGMETRPLESTNVTRALSELCVGESAWLLVTGMRGGSKTRELLMGRVARGLIESAPCPVLSIPSDDSHYRLETLVYATDFEVADLAVVRWLAEFTQTMGAKLQVVHISPQKEHAVLQRCQWFRQQLSEVLDREGIRFDMLHSDHIFDKLRIYLGDSGADMAAMLEREKNGFLRAVFHRDRVKHMEAYGRIPLLAFHESNFRAATAPM